MTGPDPRPGRRYTVAAALDVAAFDAVEEVVALTTRLEATGFDVVILGDLSDDAAAPSGFETFTLAAAILAGTTTLGVVAGGRHRPRQPYHVARRTASLDHLSAGRSGWLVPDAAATEPGRVDELTEVVRGLWDSYADDALLREAESGRFYDPARRRAIQHVGQYYRVRGPLNISRPPQGHPLVVRADSDDPTAATGIAPADARGAEPDVRIVDGRGSEPAAEPGGRPARHWLRAPASDRAAVRHAGAFDGVVLVPARAEHDPAPTLLEALEVLRDDGIVSSPVDRLALPSAGRPRTLRDILGFTRPERTLA